MIYEVSIHAPREGCDVKQVVAQGIQQCFNSRTPGGVRLNGLAFLLRSGVSIHAPREGCDRG